MLDNENCYYVDFKDLILDLEFSSSIEELSKILHSLELSSIDENALYSELLNEVFYLEDELYISENEAIIIPKYKLKKISIVDYSFLLGFSRIEINKNKRLINEIYQRDRELVSKAHMLLLKRGVKFNE